MLDLRPLHDIRVALALLTRLPLPHPTYDPDATRPMARAAWAYPLVGGVVAVLAFAVGWTLHEVLNLPTGLAAAFCLLVQIMVTGAMHEDGLADCADGFWGAWQVPRRLEIMKDSQIGTYGTLALIVSVLLRWYCFMLLLGFGYAFLPLMVAAVASRAGMVVIMQSLKNARAGGLADQTGQPGWQATGLAVSIALVAAFLGLSLPRAFLVVLVLGVACALSYLLARAKISGQTGDVLGGAQQVCDIMILTALAATIGI